MRRISVYEICISSVLLAMLIIGSKLTIPLGPIALTMQLPVVFLIIFLVNKRDSILIIGLYLILGLIGIPVFASGGGIHYIYSPSFGFIIGFLVTAIIMPRTENKYFKYFKFILGILVDYAFGAIYMYLILTYYMGKDVTVYYVLSVAVFPFLVKDIICAVVSQMIAYRLKPLLNNKYIEEPIMLKNAIEQ